MMLFTRPPASVILLLAVLGMIMKSSRAQPSILECETDQDCIDEYGFGNYCCARVNSIIRNLRQCKPIGEEGELCHVGSNYLPYPFRGSRRFWRCQCNFPQSFWCAPDPASFLPGGGRCERWVPPANTTSTSSTEDAGSG
ncbi:Hypp8891 [Branchiostoma lanceolatum]|uniref:Hypp8891 protein n=1 Tax=Branchiostoma lanceolatum TaxID=7740 RepID=A0A8K0EF35_BRALA|nr:Hypp8891 [Branchiostoma lanceolatum]